MSSRGISPTLATLLLVLIVIVIVVITYAWVLTTSLEIAVNVSPENPIYVGEEVILTVNKGELPIEGAEVSVIKDGKIVNQTYTNSSGQTSIRFLGIITTILVQKGSDWSVVVDIPVHLSELELTLSPETPSWLGQNVTVIVTNKSSGVPVESSKISVVKDGIAVLETYTNSRGQASFMYLGEAIVKAEKSGFSPEVEPIPRGIPDVWLRQIITPILSAALGASLGAYCTYLFMNRRIKQTQEEQEPKESGEAKKKVTRKSKGKKTTRN